MIFFCHIAVIWGAMRLPWEMRVSRKVFCPKVLWGSTTQGEPKLGRKRTTMGDSMPNLVWKVTWSEDERLNITVKNQNGTWKRNRSGLFTLLSPERELRSIFIWCLDYGPWVPVAAGLRKRNLVSKDKATSSNLGLRKGTIFPLWIRWRSVSHSTHVCGIAVPSHFCPAISTFPLQMLWHYSPPLFTICPTLPVHSPIHSAPTVCFPRLSFWVNAQENKSNIMFACSACFFIRYTCILNSVTRTWH